MNETEPVATRLDEQRGGRSWKLVAWVGIPLVALNVLWLALWQAGHPVQVENGPMENFQAVLLFGGTLLFFIGAARTSGAEAVLRAALGLFYFTFLVLEVDLREFDLPLINKLFNGRIRDIWVGTLWILTALWFSRHRVEGYRLFMQWVVTSGGLLLVAAGAFWGASAAVDKLHLFQPTSVNLFVEELIEISATWLMGASAFMAWRTLPWTARDDLPE